MTPNLQLHMLEGQESQEQAKKKQESGDLFHLFLFFFPDKSGMLERGGVSLWHIWHVYVLFFCESVCMCMRVSKKGGAGEVLREGSGTNYWR